MRREHREVPIKQGSDIRKSGKVFGQGQKSRQSHPRWPLCPCLHSRSANAADAKQSHARVCLSTRLDHRHANKRGWLWRIPAGVAGEADRSCTATGDRRRAGLALDRWGRSVTDLLATLQELEHLGVGFVSLTEALDLTTPAGRAMAGLLAVFAAFEREVLGERVRAGLAHARQNGKQLGRPQPQPCIPTRSANYAGPD